MAVPLRPFMDSAALARLEKDVCARLAPFFRFGASACYFTKNGPERPEWLPQENRLLLPLFSHGGANLVLRLDSVEADLVRVLPILPAIVALCLENAELEEARLSDALTGLPDEAALLDGIAARIEALHSGRSKGAFGLATFMWAAMPEPGIRADMAAISETAADLALRFRRCLGPDSLGAAIGRLAGDFGFALLWDVAGRGACQRRAVEIAAELGSATYRDAVSRRDIAVSIQAGHALYPGDISGSDLYRSPFRQALLLRDRALLAGRIAWRNGESEAMAWGWIAASGCVVEENRGLGILRISPGADANIRVGQRFSVRDRAGADKARIIVREVRERSAYAEILHIASAASQPGPGDRIYLDRGRHEESDLPDRAWFFRRFEELAAPLSRFTLAITRFQPGDAEPVSVYDSFLAGIQADLPAGAVAASYGQDGMIVFIPSDADCEFVYRRLHEEAAARGVVAITGIFSWPCLDLGREESEAQALKALDYAALLPFPHIGRLDGLALAISGDKLYSQGEELAALAEYRRALLLRPDDPAILNALGVCLASLHRSAEARRIFIEALQKCGDADLGGKIAYNLGNLAQAEKDLENAQAYYRKCVRFNSGHVYAWARLAQIASLKGKPASSVSLYRHAERLALDMPEALAMIRRQLARVEAGRLRLGRAREILHDSLLRDPADQASLLELAQTYLGEDPEIAEALARKCISLGGRATEVLAAALCAQGRNDEAARLAGAGI